MLKRLKEYLHQKKNVWISGITKLIALWTLVLRILMHHPTFIGYRKQSFKPAWTNAFTSLPFGGM